MRDRWRLVIGRQAKAYLDRLPSDSRARVLAILERLQGDPYGLRTKSLVGRPERSIRIGPYRALYDVYPEAAVIVILRIWPRGQVYRR